MRGIPDAYRHWLNAREMYNHWSWRLERARKLMHSSDPYIKELERCVKNALNVLWLQQEALATVLHNAGVRPQ